MREILIAVLGARDRMGDVRYLDNELAPRLKSTMNGSHKRQHFGLGHMFQNVQHHYEIEVPPDAFPDTPRYQGLVQCCQVISCCKH